MRAYLLDTNVISEPNRAKPDRRVLAWLGRTPEHSLYISALTLGEIRFGIERMVEPGMRVSLEQWLEHEVRPAFFDRILPVDERVAEAWGALTGSLRSRGVVVPPVDGLIAATALVHGLTVVTRNERDFEAAGVAVFNPWTA